MCRNPVVGEDDTSIDESLNQVVGWLLNQVGPERFAARVYFGMFFLLDLRDPCNGTELRVVEITYFVVSNDRDQCREVGLIYQQVWTAMVTDEYLDASAGKQGSAGDQGSWLNMMGSARHLAETFPDVPAIFVPCISGRLDGVDAMTQAVKWGSVIQAAWSFMLAARNRGLGTCWTTVHLQREEDVAEVLGIPYSEVQQVALSPVAYTVGTEFKAGRRKPEESFVHFNGW